MVLTNAQLLYLPVVTASQQPLGYVIGFEVDSEHHTISRYTVSAKRWLRRADYIITPSQIISLTPEKMTVHDTVAPVHTSPVVPVAPSPSLN